MEKNLHINPMRTTMLVLLILCICSPVQCSAQNAEPDKPAVGLIRFSIDVFDKQKELVEKEHKNVEKRFKKFLKKNFEFKEEFYFGKDDDIIAYSDIEDPDVTLDPLYESRADKKLKELSGQNKLDAIVFGHFKEEDELIVVFRCYLADDKIPKDKRIFSTKSLKIKIDKDIEVNLENAVNELASELEKELTVRIKKTQPEVKEDNSGKPENKPVESPKANEGGVQNQTEEAKNTVEEMLTAHEVYQMIIEKGFYCEIVEGSGFHGEGLTGIVIPGNGIFIEKRLVITVIEKGNDLIRTESELRPGNDEKIVLGWPLSDKIALKEISFQAAKARINTLNKQNKDDNKKWRIPTILELFSIIKQNSKNHFPDIFKFPDKKVNLIFWTSTVVKKQGTALDYDKKKAYLVVRSLYNLKNDIYSVTFAPLNIEGKEPKQAYLLPVYSEKEYRYKSITDQLKESNILGLGDDKSSTGTSTGNTTNSNPSADTQNNPPDSTGSKNHSTATVKSSGDTIPGFDDVPESHNTTTTNSLPKIVSPKAAKLSPKQIKIILIPYFSEGLYVSKKEKGKLNKINLDIENALNSLIDQVKKDLYCELIIQNKRTDDPKNSNLLTQFFNIIYPSPNDVSRDKAEKIVQNIMTPDEIDILISVLPDPDDATYFKTCVISLVGNTFNLGPLKRVPASGDIQFLINYIKGELKINRFTNDSKKRFPPRPNKYN